MIDVTFIRKANLEQCKELVNALADRVADLTGYTLGLEDAQCRIEIELESIANNCGGCGKCDSCVAARSDEHYDRKRDGKMMRRMG